MLIRSDSMAQKLKLPVPQRSRIRAIERISSQQQSNRRQPMQLLLRVIPAYLRVVSSQCRRLLNILTGISISAETYPCRDDGLNKGFIGGCNCRETSLKTMNWIRKRHHFHPRWGNSLIVVADMSIRLTRTGGHLGWEKTRFSYSFRTAH